MEINRYKTGGLFFRLEPIDFNCCDWRTFLEGVKNIPGRIYNPEEKPYDEHWWWIPESGVSTFLQYKKQLIDDVLNAGQYSLFD